MFEPKVWVGLKIYDFLAGKESILPKSNRISVDDISDKLPWLDTADVKAGYVYWDAVMNDYQILEQTANNARRSMVDIFEHEGVNMDGANSIVFKYRNIDRTLFDYVRLWQVTE